MMQALFRLLGRTVCLRRLVVCLLALFPGYVFAVCSADYHGLATINEVFKLGEGGKNQGGTNQGGNKRFVELKLLTSSISASEYDQWQVQTCAEGGTKNNPTEVCSAPISLSAADDSTYPWIVIGESLLSNSEINLQKMDILLTDGAGATIDYLSIDGFNELEDENCTPAFDWEFDPRNGNSTKNVKRQPDGTGDWDSAPGNSDKDSEGDTNDGGPEGPDISVSSATVFPGETAEFVISLAEAASEALTVEYATRDDSAEDGRDFDGQAGTVTFAPGTTSITVSVPTIVTGDRDGKRFFLDLSNPSAGQLTSQIGVGYILPEPNGYWRLESPGWSDAPGEVLDYSGNDLNGRARNGAQAAKTSPALANNPGTCGYAEFNGTDQYVEIPDDKELDLKEELTVSAWVYIREFPSGGRLKTIVSKDENYEFHLNASGEIYWWWRTTNGWTRTLTTAGANLALNTWHHVAITYAQGRQRIYVDGQLRASSSSFGELRRNNDPFQIGQDQGYFGRYFNGFIDEVRVYETALPATGIEALRLRRHVCAQNLATLAMPTPGTASVCKPVSLTLSAKDGDGDLLTDYDGTILLSTSSGHGDWSVLEGAGTLTPSVDDDDNGRAAYRFNAADGGEVRLALLNTHPDRLTITARDPDADVTLTTPVIEFLSSTLLIEPLSSLGDDIIAGRRHGFSVSLVRQDPDDGSCGVDEGYDGLFSLKAWLARSANDPGGQAPALRGDSILNGVPDSKPGSGNLDLRFNEGVASFELDTFDVGAYSLNLLNDGSGHAVDEAGEPLAIGSSLSTPPWVVRPFAFSVVASDASGGANPGAVSPTGPTFVTAGSPFNLRVAARLYQSSDDTDVDGIADDGAVLTDNAIAQSFGQSGTEVNLVSGLRLPAGGADPGLSGNLPILSGFAGGAAAKDFVFNEVGIIEVTASVSGGDYLGMGASRTGRIRGQSGPIGRFYPADFLVTVSDAGALAPSCSAGATAFTYIGEAIDYALAPEFRIEPVTEAGGVTRNYQGSFRHLESSEVTLEYPGADTNNGLTVSVDTETASLLENGDGTLRFTLGADQFTYLKVPASRVAPFTASLALNVSGILETVDDVTSSSVPVTASPSGVLVKYGRLHLDNSYGPETDPLIVPLQLQYFNGSSFVLNTDDSCWAYNTGSDASVNPTGLTSVEGEAGTVSAGTPSGARQLRLSAPGEGNTGEVTVTYAVPDWLKDDLDGDGALDAPAALATFGVYRGHDRVIYWQER